MQIIARMDAKFLSNTLPQRAEKSLLVPSSVGAAPHARFQTAIIARKEEQFLTDTRPENAVKSLVAPNHVKEDFSSNVGAAPL